MDRFSQDLENSFTYIIQNVRLLETVDGYGRRYSSVPAGEVTITIENNGRRVFIEHDADTSHSFIQNGELVTSLDEAVPAPRKPAGRIRRLIQDLLERWAANEYKRSRYRGLNGGQDD